MRETIPTLPYALVQTGRDKASESLKATRPEKRIERKSLTERYDKRTFKFYLDSYTISITTVQDMLVF
ncbi:hypothetical protein [Thermoplasma volcanium]|uniref:hypothetical protein n=1 Tax=Thermoplasma volcanium TaxID=50339 RepID=UPI001F51BB06|nr:hypothetical protein [Thermoplasma volcanium]